MAEQRSFSELAYEGKKKVTRREQFLKEMDAVIPWDAFRRRIEPHYPKGIGGRPTMPLELMLRIYFLQHWFNLSDPGAEEALYDSESMRRFARIVLGEDPVPDETTILNFRHLLEKKHLTEAMFDEVNALLRTQGVSLRSGTIVDATIIEAPSSTKNGEQKRDPEMKQTRKGRNWHYGMKVHVGTDRQGLVHSLSVTDAAVNDLRELGSLLHGDETEIFGDQAYSNQDLRQQAEEFGIRYRVNRRITRDMPKRKAERIKRVNRERSRTRARGEHGFQVVKHQWGFRRVRYRGLHKNTVRVFAAFALANLYMARKQLLGTRERCRR